MAIAYSGKRFGNAATKIKVADKIILEAEIPRVLTMGDSLVSTITLLNPNNLKGEVELSVSVEGPLKTISENSFKLPLEEGKNNTTTVSILTKSEVGLGKIIIETDGIAKVKTEVEISIRHLHLLSLNLRRVQFLVVKDCT